MYLKRIDFSRYSSIRIGQPEDVLILEKGDSIPEGHYLIGGANNLLVSPNPRPLMMLGKDFSSISQEKDILTVGAAIPSGRIVSYAKKNDIGGFEFMTKLPGTAGGMLAMNAGVKEYEIFSILESVEIDKRWIDKRDIRHGYRYAKLPGIATAARFRISRGYDNALALQLQALRANQPSQPSAGSIFKNPDGDFAGRLIESVGLKGYRSGDMAWSDIHANFLVNLGRGKFEDAMKLITMAEKRVFDDFGIRLEKEIKIV